MGQMENTISIPVIVLTLGFYILVAFAQDTYQGPDEEFGDSEYKRFNFGLGKRNNDSEIAKRIGVFRMHSITDDIYPAEDEEHPFYLEKVERKPELDLYNDYSMQSLEKRPHMYNFGLGKRIHRYNFGLGKRGQVYRYDFGLGKRSEPSFTPDRLYNFGLGKRIPNSYVIKHRSISQPELYDFVGDYDVPEGIKLKREVREVSPQEEQIEETKSALDSTRPSTEKMEKVNKNAELESHEIMGHPDKSQPSKRNAGFPLLNGNLKFSREFKKPGTIHTRKNLYLKYNKKP